MWLAFVTIQHILGMSICPLKVWISFKTTDHFISFFQTQRRVNASPPLWVKFIQVCICVSGITSIIGIVFTGLVGMSRHSIAGFIWFGNEMNWNWICRIQLLVGRKIASLKENKLLTVSFVVSFECAGQVVKRL